MNRRLSVVGVLVVALAWLLSGLAVSPASAVAPTITSFAPTSGTIATNVAITGTAFTGATRVRFNGVDATTFTVSSDTKIVAKVPAGASTGKITVTTPGGSAVSTSNFTVAPGFTRTASAGPGGTSTLTGVGYAPYERIDLYVDTTDVQLVAADAKGAFGPVAVTIPASTTSGTHYLSAEGRSSGRFSQASVLINVNWAMIGGGPGHSGANLRENTLSPSTVGNLDELWHGRLSFYGNHIAFAEYGGAVFAETFDHVVSAFADSGKLLWKTAGTGGCCSTADLAVGAGKVFVDAGSGNVAAYPTNCRSDGGTCTTTSWTHNVGTGITSGLTYAANLVYVPSADGTVHVLSAATGAEPQTPIAPFNCSSGVSTPVTLSGGDSYIGCGNAYSANYSIGGASGRTYGGAVSMIAWYAGRPFYTDNSGSLHGNTDTATTGSGCFPVAPAGAGGAVAAAGCTSLGVYATSDGTARWVRTGLSTVTGVSAANGVVYGCVSGVVRAYDKSSGADLWSGGYCDGPPMVVNNTVYTSGQGAIWAFRIGGTDPNTVRPSARALVPDRSLRLAG